MLSPTGATLSRWTLSYFAIAVSFLLLAELLMTLGFGYPSAALRAPDTLIVVHAVTIGWLTLLMFGALFQFVPVLIAGRLYSNTLPLPALICLVAGLIALLLSFLQLGGHLPLIPHCFAAASVLLGAGFAIALWTLGRTLARAWPLNLPARFVAAGLACVFATATFGIIFTLGFGGYADVPVLNGLHARGLPLHIIAGLGGWLTLTAIGVSHRLLAMFMLSPELDGPRTHWTFHLGTLALAIVILAGTVAAVLDSHLNLVLLVGGLAGLGCLGLYGRDVLELYGKRIRRTIELNSHMARFALGHLAAAVALTIVCTAFGLFERLGGALVFLVCFGWLTGLGLAKLYKIIAFVTWLECYGPVLGRTPTPRVQDLVVEPRAVRWFWLYFGAVDIATLALLAGMVPVFRVAAGAMLIATAAIAVELLRTRRLVNVKEDLRLPAGTRQPRLFFTLIPS